MLDVATPQLPLWSERDTSEGWVVRESARARRLTVRVFHTGRVEVVVPARTSQKMVQMFVERHRSWIERKRAEARSNTRRLEPFPPASIVLTAADETWRLHLAAGRGRLRLASPSPGLVSITGDLTNAQAVRELLRQWLNERAREVLGPMLEEVAAELSCKFGRMTIRRQRTRWGSCSTRGTISLNCCLMFQRPEVVRYLLVHELAHTQHMNHSRRFWQFVARHCPNYETLDRELLDGWRRVPSWVFSEGDV